MDAAFDKLAHAEPAVVSASPQARAPHTTSPADAAALVQGYLAFLRHIAGWRPPAENRCLDLGAGVGHIAEAFTDAGCRMTASEHTEAGVALIRELCPAVQAEKKNIAEFREPESYDLIFSREVYVFTRINAYPEQSRIVSNIVDSLKPGGAFLLAGSDVCWPQCLDYDRLIRSFRADGRLRLVSKKHYEFIFRRFGRRIRGPLTYALFSLALAPLIEWKRRARGFARIRIIAFVKNDKMFNV